MFFIFVSTVRISLRTVRSWDFFSNRVSHRKTSVLGRCVTVFTSNYKISPKLASTEQFFCANWELQVLEGQKVVFVGQKSRYLPNTDYEITPQGIKIIQRGIQRCIPLMFLKIRLSQSLSKFLGNFFNKLLIIVHQALPSKK